MTDAEKILSAIECGEPKPVSSGYVLDRVRLALREPEQVSLLAFEAGFKACERGENLDMALSKI